MENDQNKKEQNKPAMTQEELLAEIYKNTKKAKTYMQWQLYITLILVVLPLLASLFIVPMVMRELTASYGSLLQ